MAGFNEMIGRTNVPIPTATVNEILAGAPAESVALTRMRKARMTTKSQTQPVLSTLPDAYWVNGDTGLKQTTHAEWGSVSMTAEELAVLVPVPNAVIDDSDMDIWGEIRPLLVEAIGKKVDQAVLFGVDKPASFPAAMVPQAIAVGNVVTRSETTDLGQDVAALGQRLATQGYSINGFASSPGLQWELIGLRATGGAPIYTPSLSAGAPSGLYGFPLQEVTNGAWNASAVTLLAADWSKFIVGIRQDITFDLFDQMIISDDAGKVVFNAAQQDSKVMRVVFRLGYQVANPLNRLPGAQNTKYAAGIIAPDVTP